MPNVIGIDAGGTKTVGLLADGQGKVLSETRGGGANLQTAGELEVEKVLDGILEALDPQRRAAALCLGIAGVDRPADEQVIRGILRRLGYRETARVVNDAAIALAAGAPARMGIVVLAGTGSIAYGADRTGRTVRSGGYGFLLADEGSAYWFGHQALRLAVRAADGRGPETLLRPLLFQALEVDTVQDLVPRVYERGLPKHRIAALAGNVQRASDAGDPLAAELIQRGAHELALAARAVARQLDFTGQAYPVVVAGGAFKACPGMMEPLERALDLPGAHLAPLQAEPATGAVALALDLVGSGRADG
jgi:N-acetylglucosamine kinase-like BadF-type ATPase